MDTLKEVNQKIIVCTRCSRLVPYLAEVGEKKVKRYQDCDYWSKPVPSWGDEAAQLLIIGLAPGAHGANRTGRMFTGDDSGDWLTRAMYETGFANQTNSDHLEDGLELKDCYIASAAHCAPPQNKLTAQELNNCSSYLRAELPLLKQVKVILALGGVGFKSVCKTLEVKGLVFGHHKQYRLDDGRILLTSFHPSKYNTQTKRLTWEDWLAVFQTARKIIDSDD